MCGIAGALAVRDADELVRRMNGALTHRGPDDSGHAALLGPTGEPTGAVGHRRLAVIDLSSHGHQPMTAGAHTIVFNGEIYNFETLREELIREGTDFVSRSDTEVVLRGFARYGSAFFQRLRGMFAIALWDRERSTLVLARDRFGMKPLYCAEIDGGLLFASEARALLASGRVPRRLSADALPAFLEQGAVPEPLSVLDAVRPVAPGTTLEVRLDQGRIARRMPPRVFANPIDSPPAHEIRAEPAVAQVREALRESVRCHLVSDVPVGIFLSGGIDSSTVVALASEAARQPLETFTVTFEGQDPRERSAARAVAQRFRCNHHQVQLSWSDVDEAVRHGLRAMDQPTIDGLNTFVISRSVHAAGLKVVLSGLGADELFGGYPSFRRASAVARGWNFSGLPRRLLAAVARRGGSVRAGKVALLAGERTPARAGYRSSRALFDEERIRLLCGRLAGAYLADPPPALGVFEQVSFYELTGYLRNTLLRDSDVFSMANGVELRVPFVDAGVAGAVTAIDSSLKRGDKSLLVRAVRELIPSEVLNRPKLGFTLPMDEWMRRSLGEPSSHADGLARVGVSLPAANRVWEDYRRGRLTWSRPWALFTLAKWAEDNDVHATGAGR